MANSVDPDEMLHSAASHLGQHCFFRPVCPNTNSIHSSAVDCKGIIYKKKKTQISLEIHVSNRFLAFSS